MSSVNIVPYTFINAERLRYGRHPALDTVFYRWTRRIEETLYKSAGVEVYAGASVVEEMKFSAFFSMLKQPRPIYFFTLSPLGGQGLLVFDNRFTAFCLRLAQGETRVRVESKLSPKNQGRLQRVVQRLTEDFDRCWAGIHPDVEQVKTRLNKITTLPFRARIVNPYENCMVAQVHLSGRGISSRILWCLPSKNLQPLLSGLERRNVIPPEGLEDQPGERIDPERLLEHLRYGFQVRMGQVDLSGLSAPLDVGQVIPVKDEGAGRAVVELEGDPTLMAEVGRVDERMSIKIDRKYVPPPPTHQADPARFQPIRWPEATTE